MENKKEMQKTQVFNVVILDKSGSMECIRKAAVDGFNETLAGIKKAQKQYADTQDHFVSLVTFCSCKTDKVFDRLPVADAHPLTLNDYEPCCCTPLYDAMGFTLTDLHRYVKDLEDAMVVVTIITDGLENASKEYNAKSIKALVEQLRTEGWTFTYMGANQDSVEVAISMSINNSRDFAYNEEGTRATMHRDTQTRLGLFGRLAYAKSQGCAAAPMSREERRKLYTDMADDAFNDV